MTPDGSHVYVGITGGPMDAPDSVSVIDTASNTVATSIPVAGDPTATAVTPDGTHVYAVIDFATPPIGLNNVSVIDTASNTVTATIPVGVGPSGVAIQPGKPALTCDGTPGFSNCHGQCVAGLAHQYGGIDAAARTLGYSSVKALQTAIKTFCRG